MSEHLRYKSSALQPARPADSPNASKSGKVSRHAQGFRLNTPLWVIVLILAFAAWSTYHFFSDEVSVWMTDGAMVETAVGPQYFAQPFSWSSYVEHVSRGADTGSWLSWKYCAALILFGSLLAVVRFLWPLYQSLRAQGAISAVGSVAFIPLMVILAGPLELALAHSAAENLVNHRIDAFEKDLLSGGFSRCGTVYGANASGHRIQAELYQLGCSEIVLDVATKDRYAPFAALERDKTLQSITLIEDLTLCSAPALSEKSPASAALQDPTRRMVLAPVCHQGELTESLKKLSERLEKAVKSGL